MDQRERKQLSNSLKFDKALLITATVIVQFLCLLLQAFGFMIIFTVVFAGLFYQLYKLPRYLSYDRDDLFIKTKTGEVSIPLYDVTDIEISSSVWWRTLWRISFVYNNEVVACHIYPKYEAVSINKFINIVKNKNPKVYVTYVWIG